ncbi:MAG: hypothetical protein J6Q53_05310 [Oscillospiraceae bacterium]|nr:hypothetical protein [Oscillospiraceae bacterium]
MDRGKALTGGQLANLVEANEKQFVAEDMVSIQSAAEGRLVELGETGDVSTVAAALTKRAAGQKLTRAEQQAISNSRYGQWVANELNSENIRSGEYASAWAENIDTQRINAQEYSRMVEAAQLEQEGAGEQSAENPPVTAGAATAPFRQGSLGAEETSGQGGRVKTLPYGQEVEAATGKEALQVAESGKTTLQETGQEVAIREIVKAADGKLTLRLEDGRTVDADEIAYGSEGEALLYEGVATLGADPEVSNLLVNTYRDHAEGVAAGDYALGMVEAFRYGTYNIPKAELESNSFTAKLTALQRNTAYALGQRYGGKQVATAEAKARRARFARNYQKAAQTESKADKKGQTKGSGKVQFMEGSKRSDLREYVKQSGKQLSRQQETAITTMEKLSAILGVNFYVYESYVKDGKRLYVDENGTEKPAPNGRYTNGRDIYIDLNAGTGGRGTMLYTVAHELTHYIRQWSPAKFKKNGKRNAIQKTWDKIDNLGLSPVRNVERMSGYNQNSSLLKLFKKFEQGIRKKNKFVMEAYKSLPFLVSAGCFCCLFAVWHCHFVCWINTHIYFKSSKSSGFCGK